MMRSARDALAHHAKAWTANVLECPVVPLNGRTVESYTLGVLKGAGHKSGYLSSIALKYGP